MTPQEIEALLVRNKELDRLLAVAEKQTAQLTLIALGDLSINEIQAEAGRKGFIECATRWNLCNAFGEFVSPEEIEAVANEYAAKVRQGGAE